jgi:hypothetical protein
VRQSLGGASEPRPFVAQQQKVAFVYDRTYPGNFINDQGITNSTSNTSLPYSAADMTFFGMKKFPTPVGECIRRSSEGLKRR